MGPLGNADIGHELDIIRWAQLEWREEQMHGKAVDARRL